MLLVQLLIHLAGALQSWLYGKVIGRLEPEAMALGDSHGYETADSKRYMRQSVIISDLIGVFASAYVHQAAVKETMSQVSHVLLDS